MNMELLESGFGVKSSPNFILGFTDDETVMLDLDNMSFKKVKQLAQRASEFWNLGGFLVLKSSEGSYHVVFDRPVSWRENMQVVAWAVIDSGSEDLKRWLVMQCRKGSSTLRVGRARAGSVLWKNNVVSRYRCYPVNIC